MATRSLPVLLLLVVLSTPLSAQTGDLQVFVSTSGANLDADGYVVTLDDRSQSISVNGSVAFSGLVPGTYTASLIDVAENCNVQGANPRTAVIAEDGVAELRFEVRCSAQTPMVGTQASSSSSRRGVPLELGVDFGVQISILDDGPTATLVGVPASRFRVGIFASDVFAIEPAFALAFVSVEGFQSTELGFQTAFVYHSSPHRNRSRAFVQVIGGITYANIEGFDATQFSVGGGIGGKFPIVDHLAARLEANYFRGFKNDDAPGANSIEFLFGFSFFTR